MDNKARKSQNQFTPAEIQKVIRQQEESRVTSRYDEAYQEEQALAENRILAKEMLNLSPEAVREEKW
jgi:HEPN domain-containing protein